MKKLTRKRIFDLKEETATINTGCHDKKGNFRCYRAEEFNSVNDNNYFATQERGCCNRCAANKGYLLAHQDLKNLTADELRNIWSKFDGQFGFWGVIKWDTNYSKIQHGCILPRKYRSLVCIGFYCSKVINPKERDKLNKIMDKLGDL